MKKYLLIILALFLLSCGKADAKEWEHGYQTSLIRATRYKHDLFGWNIGFVPLTAHAAYVFDRGEVIDFIQKENGRVFQGGGSPYAEMFVIFSDVKDKESANKKLKILLPKFDHLLTTLK